MVIQTGSGNPSRSVEEVALHQRESAKKEAKTEKEKTSEGFRAREAGRLPLETKLGDDVLAPQQKHNPDKSVELTEPPKKNYISTSERFQAVEISATPDTGPKSITRKQRKQRKQKKQQAQEPVRFTLSENTQQTGSVKPGRPFSSFNNLQDVLDANHYPTITGKEGKNREGGETRKISHVLNNAASILAKIEKSGLHDSRQLQLFRTVSENEANAVLEWAQTAKDNTEQLVSQFKGIYERREETGSEWNQLGIPADATINRGFNAFIKKNPEKYGIIPTKNHFGNLTQAAGYKKEGNYTLAFTLKPGAHEFLFSQDALAAVPGHKNANRVVAFLESQNKGPIAKAAQGEGVLPGYIGLKGEESDGGFSLGVGDNNASKLLFQLLVAEVRVVEGLPSQRKDSPKT